ncbi:MAG TPA: MBL fold metallo-hydrolase, partial [Croceibacterium sp.]|nr:MBL fold metallo-hydrolase [Croceibacterium sp.]
MFVKSLVLLPVLLAAACSGVSAQPTAPADNGSQWAERCKDWDDWDKPAPPFRIWGNTYYVGTCGISAILVTGTDGHVLIDGGPANAAPLIAANIEALGFKLSDVKILLHSHEHHDHVGGLAELQRLTGARLLASPAAAAALASGAPTAEDPQVGEHATFPAARVD